MTDDRTRPAVDLVHTAVRAEDDSTMWAKPTRWARWRNLTLSEWVGVVSAGGTMLSAIFALMAATAARDQVKASNDQIKATTDAVNRTEKLKALSDFSASSRTYCRSILPEEWQGRIRARFQSPGSPSVAPQDLYYIFGVNRDDIAATVDLAMKTLDKRFANNLDLISKAHMVSAWLDDNDNKKDVVDFAMSLHYRVNSIAKRKGSLDWVSIVEREYSLCEYAVNEKIKVLIKQ